MIVATHSGSFHADDVFAFAMLCAALPETPELSRSRKAEDWDRAAVVFDVGGVFDPARGRYDHHMRDKPLRASGEAYSSAGLIWADYGRQALAHLLPEASPAQRDEVWGKLDQGLVRDIDLMDNGQMTAHPGHLSTLLEAWVPTHVEPGADETAAFRAAAVFAAQVLERVALQAFAACAARDAVAAAASAAQAAGDPRVIVLDARLPWEEAVFDLGLDQALYVVRPAGADWTVSAVPPSPGAFGQRLSLPAAWGGLRDGDLAAICGIADATFCHSALFVCGARSRDGAVAMARLAADQ